MKCDDIIGFGMTLCNIQHRIVKIAVYKNIDNIIYNIRSIVSYTYFQLHLSNSAFETRLDQSLLSTCKVDLQMTPADQHTCQLTSVVSLVLLYPTALLDYGNTY